MKAAAVFFVAAALAIPAVASAKGPPGGGGYSPPEQIPQTAQCDSGAASGAFGAFGTYGDGPHDYGVNYLGTDGHPGADGTKTGANNSGVCNP